MPVDNFEMLHEQPDEMLKAGLKTIDGRLLHTAMAEKPDDFIDRLMRCSSKVMLGMFKDDHEEYRGNPKYTADEQLQAQQSVVMLFNKFLEKQNGGG